MSLLDKIKSDVKKSGSNKGKLFFTRQDVKGRVRFLTDMDDGLEVVFHDSFEKGINTPCKEAYGKQCQLCDDDSLRTRSLYGWPVWDYEAAEVKLFIFAVNNCTPIPALMALYETYGTITDRDYVISYSGKAQNKSYSVIPMDKARFKNSKAKPLSTKKMLDIVMKAYPYDGGSEDDDFEDEDEFGYEDMTASELYKLCKTKDIEVEPRKKKAYYIDLLESQEDKAEEDDWEDEAEEEAGKYDELSPKELYKLCKDRDIEVESKKPGRYYANLLEEDDKAEDDWGKEDDEDGEDEWE